MLLLIAFVATTGGRWPVGRAIDLISQDGSFAGRHGAKIVAVQDVPLHSDATVSFACSAEAPPEHVMILNPPFLLLMKRKNAQEPYLACWIANADLLKEK